jgi:hypothetical protein
VVGLSGLLGMMEQYSFAGPPAGHWLSNLENLHVILTDIIDREKKK